ncbi:hypothetical protein TanjilG_00234 [Lupinus angustifolius]|uniref:Uncharacterized protein n=1 Tax=Lupinus angustifolius TaxID=3871 RepID=A0A394D3L6_LUPAN|nr:PREDICTED: uncharacterized protein LOC109337018 isoform X2 [Lupinus angustifolius]OIW17854.1 hypothetical protein TanjilG_00234 [Lupinus angustifolius]
MARFTTLVTSLPKFGHAGVTIARASAWNPRVFAAATPRPIQVPKSPNQDGSITIDGIKEGASETVNNNLNEPLQDNAYSSTTEHVTNKTKDMAGQASIKAQNITEKAKQTMQEAWDSTKKTANKAADNVMGKTQESADYVKDNAETVRKNMNRKE